MVTYKKNVVKLAAILLSDFNYIKLWTSDEAILYNLQIRRRKSNG
jgi:hypothetical protein